MMKKRTDYKIVQKIGKCAILVAFALFALSCATKPEAYKNIDIAVKRDDFKIAIEAIRAGQEAKNPIYAEKNSIMLFLDKGLLEYYAGDYENSSKDLQEAERLIEEAFTKSITAGFMSYIANDNTKDYPGEDFEDIYLNVFNALNYYNKGNIEGALVEIRKLTLSSGKLSMLAQKYNYKDPESGLSIEDRIKKDGSDTSQLPTGKPVEFSNSALARFLAALFYLADKNTDSARIEFQEVPKAFASSNNVYKNPVPKAVQEAQAVPGEKARLNIIGFTGLSPIKQEEIVVHHFPFFKTPVLRETKFKLPKLVARPSSINRVEVIVNGNDKFELELLEDMGAVIQETFAVRYANTVLKTYIRALIKYTAADIAASETAKKTGGGSGILGVAAAVGNAAGPVVVKKALEASEAADVRMSRFMPDKAYVGGINLDPGNYNITVNFLSGNTVVASVERKDFSVNQNALNLIDVTSLR